MNAEPTHTLPNILFERAVTVHVIGCGGTGSQLLPRLVQLHQGMLALGHPGGLSVCVWDGDTVAEHNCLRQNFYPCDVGRNKASVMVNRINIAHNLDWRDYPERFTASALQRFADIDFIIGCVDSKSARREILGFARTHVPQGYWIDAGNEADSGQVVVGQFGERIVDDPRRLPLPAIRYPEIVSGEDDDAPSCSARESLLRQGMATNAMASAWIFAWLSEALRNGQIDHAGVFFNLKTGRCSPIPLDMDSIQSP